MKAVTLVQVHSRQPSKRSRNYCRAATRPRHLRQRHTVVTAPVIALCLVVSVVFFSIGWTIAGNAARGSWEDDVAALTFLRDSSKELNDYFGDSEDPSDWTGVAVTDGRVTGLTLEKCSNVELPDAIASVEELDDLTWCASLAAVPEAVRRLNALEELYFVDSDDVPAEPAPETPPTTFPCFGHARASPSHTPSSLCPEPRMRSTHQRNLRGGGRRDRGRRAPVHSGSW